MAGLFGDIPSNISIETGQSIRRNATNDGWESASASDDSGVVPIGGIIMWSGTIATIPIPDWQLCDGTNNSPGPDLRDKFIVGAKQDDTGIAKTNIQGSLAQTGGATGHSHPLTISDHTGLTHGLTIANHPDLTHVALASHPAVSTSIASHPTATASAPASHPTFSYSVPSHPTFTASAPASHPTAAGTDPAFSYTLASHPTFTASAPASHPSYTTSIASHPTLTDAGMSHAAFTTGAYSLQSGTASRLSLTLHTGSVAIASHPTQVDPGNTHAAISISGASHPVLTIEGQSHPVLSVPSGTISVPGATHAVLTIEGQTHPNVTAPGNTHAALTVEGASHANISIAGMTHGGVGSHIGTDYGVHSITAPASHGAAGTVTHSFAETSVSQLPTFFALAFIQRMS
jgi:hypothetical protein